MIKEGVIPIIAGAAVTAFGTTLKAMEMEKRIMHHHRGAVKNDDIIPAIAGGIIGFGLAHIALGAIDLKQKRHNGFIRRTFH